MMHENMAFDKDVCVACQKSEAKLMTYVQPVRNLVSLTTCCSGLWVLIGCNYATSNGVEVNGIFRHIHHYNGNKPQHIFAKRCVRMFAHKQSHALVSLMLLHCLSEMFVRRPCRASISCIRSDGISATVFDKVYIIEENCITSQSSALQLQHIGQERPGTYPLPDLRHHESCLRCCHKEIRQ